MTLVSVDINENILLLLLYYGLAALSLEGTLSVERQTLYHHFAHPCGDLWSNMAFVLAGVYHLSQEHYVFAVLLHLVALGSTYYHQNPNNWTLLWDRVPMILSLGYILHVILRLDLILVTVLGLIMVYHWYKTMDLEPYAAFQMASCVLLFVHHPKARYAILLYGLAKYCEDNDISIYKRLGVSGHTLKHTLSGLALGMLDIEA